MSYLEFFEPHINGLQKSGMQYKAYCPFHPDEGSTKKGFSLNAEKGLWNCFSCGVNGNVYTFFKKLGHPIPNELLSDSPPEWEGFRYLIYRTPKNEQEEKWEPETLSPPNEKWGKKASHLIKSSIIHLNRSPKCDEIRYWLMKERGLSGEALKRLGWNPATTYYSSDSWGLERKADLWIPAGLVIAVIQDSAIQRIQIRRPIEEDHILLPGSTANAPMRLVNGNRHAIVVESDLDALLLWRVAGDLVDVFSLRSASNRPDVNATKILRKSERILVALDSDAAGRENTAWWLANFPNARNFPLPSGQGKDPGEAYKNKFNMRNWICDEINGKDISSDDLKSKTNLSKVEVQYTEKKSEILKGKNMGLSQAEQVDLVKNIFEGEII